MICPHCKKPIEYVITDKIRTRVRSMKKDGYSCRDIASLLTVEGIKISFSTVSRISVEKKE